MGKSPVGSCGTTGQLFARPFYAKVTNTALLVSFQGLKMRPRPVVPKPQVCVRPGGA